MARTLRDNQASWDALFYAIITGCTAKDALLGIDRKSTRLNSSHIEESRMPSSA